MLARRLLMLALPLALAAPPALADDIGDEPEEEEEEEDTASEDDEDDKGCATVVAPVSALSLALGVGIVLVQRRRED
jgi:hypothetical protein